MITIRIVLLLTFLQLLMGCSEKTQNELTFTYEGTTWSVLYKDEVGTERVKPRLTEALNQLDSQFSESISQFNALDNTKPLQVSRMFSETLRLSKMISDNARGCFDITAAPVLDLWNKGETVPQPEAIEQSLENVGSDKYLAYGNFVRKLSPAVEVSLTPLIESIRTRALANNLIALDIHHFSITSPSTTLVSGSYGDKVKSIKLQSDMSSEKLLSSMSELNQTFATVNLDALNSTRKIMIDARTGRPVPHDGLSVTVLHDDVIRAQAWANSLACLGVEDGMSVAKGSSIRAIFTQQSDTNTTTVTTSFPGPAGKDANS